MNNQIGIESKFLKAFTLSILMTIKENKIHHTNKQVINADLVPHLSENITRQRMLVERKIYPVPTAVPKAIEITQVIPAVKQPIMPKVPLPPKAILLPQKQMQKVPMPSQKPALTKPVPADYKPSDNLYGKINPLINDPAITIIECNGAGQNISIVRAGQRQFTRISLNPVEIKELLDKIAEKARVPLLEGVFKAAVDNFIINAVVSTSVGSRFLIKKQTPYSLLDSNQQIIR